MSPSTPEPYEPPGIRARAEMQGLSGTPHDNRGAEPSEDQRADRVRATIAHVFACTEEQCGYGVAALTARNGPASLSHWRHVAVAVCIHVLAIPKRDVAEYMGRGVPGIAQMMRGGWGHLLDPTDNYWNRFDGSQLWDREDHRCQREAIRSVMRLLVPDPDLEELELEEWNRDPEA